jgi:hypothetical protein
MQKLYLNQYLLWLERLKFSSINFYFRPFFHKVNLYQFYLFILGKVRLIEYKKILKHKILL